VLTDVVNNYRDMNAQSDIANFYKFIYAERVLNPSAAMIMLTETETMLHQTKSLFTAMKRNGLLNFRVKDIDLATTMFCLTIHELLDIESDRNLNNMDCNTEEIYNFIVGFCNLYN